MREPFVRVRAELASPTRRRAARARRRRRRTRWPGCRARRAAPRAAGRDRAARRAPCRRTRRRNNRNRRSSPHYRATPSRACCSSARPPRITWSTTSMPISTPPPRPAAASAPRHPGSAPDRPTDDCGTARCAAAPALAASRKTSRGWTMLASSGADRHDRRPQHAVLGVEQHDAELLDRRGCRIAAAGSRPGRAGT